MFDAILESIDSEIAEIRRTPKRKYIKVEYYRLIEKLNEDYFLYELYVSEYVSKMAEDVALELISKRQKLEAIITSVEENQLIKVRTKTSLTEEMYKINMEFDPTFLLKYLSSAIEKAKDSNNPIVEQIRNKIPSFKKIEIDDLYEIDSDELNVSQRAAIDHSENNQITLIWGPPGTGKTHTLSKIIYRSFLRDESILIMSTSNVALDHILLKLDKELYEEEKDSVLRLGNTNSKEIWRYTKDYKKFDAVKPKKVVFSTLANLAVKYETLDAFDVVMVDEASMVALPYILVAASKSVRNMVILGDFRQLPPIAMNENNRLFKMSIFEYLEVSKKISKEEKVPYMAMLDTQYRMCEPISELVNNLFYNGLLKCGVKTQNTDPLNIIYVDNTSYCDTYFSVADGSYFNPISIPIIDHLLNKEISNTQEVLIVSPFRPQQNMLNAIFQDRVEHKGRSLTIHKAQGSESDVVIVDFTTHEKTNKSEFHQFFTTDITANLINVALSRAKSKLYIISSNAMLNSLKKESELWSKILDRINIDFKSHDAYEMLSEYPTENVNLIADPKKEFTVIDTTCDKAFFTFIKDSKAATRNFISNKGCIPAEARREVTFRDLDNDKLPYIAILDEKIYLSEKKRKFSVKYEKTAKILKRISLEKFIDTEEIDRASTFDLSCAKCDGNYMLHNNGSFTVLQCPKCRDTKQIGRQEALLLKDLYKLKCPDCGADVTPRQKKGHSNYSFFGCLNYPYCNGSKHMYSIARGY